MADGAVRFPEIASLKNVASLNDRLAGLGLEIRAEPQLRVGPDSPLAQPIRVGKVIVGNRWCVQPMQGWDGTPDGRPTNWTQRRWRHFGQSGAKLIWGGEAVAVRQDGRAHPNQLLMTPRNAREIRNLRELLADEHAKAAGRSGGLLVGLQLTHAGRFARPHSHDRAGPKILYHHPILDAQAHLPPDHPLVTDDWIEELIEAFVRAAQLAAEAGFDFVDIKHCHGYLGHEFLSAHTRPGPYGGSFENRTRFLTRVAEGIQRRAVGLMIGVRLSAFDTVPYEGGPQGPGRPRPFEHLLPYRWGFGLDPNDPLKIDLAEPIKFVKLCRDLGVVAINVSAGSPYYSPHIQRPAAFPASGGYLPPEDPLAGVGRLIQVTAELKAACPEMVFVGSGYSYLQEYVGQVAQWAVAKRKTDFVGLGRMVLCYWELPGDLLAGRPIQRRRVCRTFSDCTTGPRTGVPSGCLRLDKGYSLGPHGQELSSRKRQGKS